MGAPGRQLRRLLRSAHQRWPRSFVWPMLLGGSYMRLALSAPRESEARRRYAAEAFRWQEREDASWPRDDSAFDEYLHLRRLALMADMAFESGHLERAMTCASEALRIPEVAARIRFTRESDLRSSMSGDRAVHDGHIILGRIALARGDPDEAARRLQLAGQAASSSDGAMATLGPDLSLAQDLLESGRISEVVGFLLACRGAWILGRRDIDGWVRAIRAGTIPRLEIRRFPSLRSQIELLATMRRPTRPT